MKLRHQHKASRLLLGVSLLALPLSAAWSQAPKIEIEQQPLPELPNSISGGETVRDRMNKFVREQNLRDMKDNKKDADGRDVMIEFATATIAAPASDPNFVNARIAAFNKAMLNAKGQCVEFQKTLVSTEAVKDVGLPPAERAREDAEQLKRAGLSAEGATKVAQALNADIKGRADTPQVIQTAALYGEKLVSMKMAEELRKKGLDPNKPVEAQAAKAIAETQSFRNMVSTVAAARCTGLKAIASFEQNPASGQGTVGIVTVWTEKLHAVADAIATNQWDLVPKSEPGKKIQDHIPDDKRTLLTTFGTQLVRDDRGDYVLLAYAQAQPRTKNQQSIDSAYEVAKTRGLGLIRSFLGEAVETNRDLRDAEVSTVFADESTRYQEDSSFQRKVKAVGDALPISGITVAYEWETLHPASNAPVVGVVLQWKADSARIAAALSKMNQTRGPTAAVGGGAAVSGGSAGSGGGSNSAAPAPRKADAYSGQGKAARDF